MRTSVSEVGQQAVGRSWWKITLIVAAYVEPDGARQQPTGSLYFDVARPLSTALSSHMIEPERLYTV